VASSGRGDKGGHIAGGGGGVGAVVNPGADPEGRRRMGRAGRGDLGDGALLVEVCGATEDCGAGEDGLGIDRNGEAVLISLGVVGAVEEVGDS